MATGPWRAAPWRVWAPACRDLGGLGGGQGWWRRLRPGEGNGVNLLGLDQLWVSQDISPCRSLCPGRALMMHQGCTDHCALPPCCRRCPPRDEGTSWRKRVHIAPGYVDLPRAAHAKCLLIKSIASRAIIWQAQPGMAASWSVLALVHAPPGRSNM